MRTSHAAIALLLAACGAHAQSCTDIVLTGMPDFDQRRSVECPLGVGWLPGNGQAYSAPAAVMNLIAHLANNGVPHATTPEGPQDWSSDALYNDVTAMIAELGGAMQTHPEDGTHPYYFESGLRTYLENHGVSGGTFYVSTFARWGQEDGADLLAHAADIMHSGGLATLGVAWMSHSDLDNTYLLQARHVVSLVGVTGACEEHPHVFVHDPSTNDSVCEQEGFVDRESSCTFVEANFDFHVHINFSGRYRLNQLWGSHTAFIDGVRGFFPPTVIAPCEPGLPCLRLYRPYWWLQDPGGPVQDIQLELGAPIRHLALSPEMTSVFLTTPRTNFPATLQRFSLATQELEPLASFVTTPGAMAVDRFGAIFMVFGNQVRRYEVENGAAVVRAAIDTDFAPDAIVYDDVSDELVGVDAESRRLMRWPRELSGEASLVLPNTVDLSGLGLIALNPQDNRVWVMGTSGRAAFEIVTPVGAPPRATRADLQGITQASAFNVDPTGRIIVAQGGLMHVFVKDVGGDRWEVDPASPFEDQPIGPVFVIPRSRDNYTGRQRETMELDFGMPMPTPCSADFNLDGVVNSQDLFDFLSAFFRGAPSADFNHDDARNSQDFFDFLRAFLRPCHR